MRGVMYIIWGNTVDTLLDRSLASLRKFHPDLPVHVERLDGEIDPFKGLLHKSKMQRLSPYSTTLFLDADTVVMDKLDFAFDAAERHGLACCICESPWAKRHKGLENRGDMIEYNTGVLFFSEHATPVFEAWERIAPNLDSSLLFVDDDGKLCRQPHDDQAAFALAVHETAFVPYVLPLNWNFRPNFFKSFFGPVKIWHHYRPPGPTVMALSDYYRESDSVIQYIEDPKHWA